jgi:hypothetical protein
MYKSEDDFLKAVLAGESRYDGDSLPFYIFTVVVSAPMKKRIGNTLMDVKEK